MFVFRPSGNIGKVRRNIDLAGIKSGLRQHHYGPGPHPDGSDQSVHGGDRAGSDSARVWSGRQHEAENQLSKLEAGAIGEQLAERALEEKLGVDIATLNVGINNSPIDLGGDHVAVEVKAGVATNGRSAQQWRATLGGAGPAETQALKSMSREQKAAWFKKKSDLILVRKNALLDKMSAELGAPVKAMTVGVILSPDGKRGDVYAVDGFHLRLGWTQYATDEYYMGTYDVTD
jgi:hypothetical protein